MFSLFSKKPVLDEGSANWMFEAYAWALRNFGSDFFRDDTILVTPTPRHFPDKAQPVEEVVANSLKRVIGYAGMQNWPLQPLPLEACGGGDINPLVPLQIANAPRGNEALVTTDSPYGIPVPFEPRQARTPALLIAVFAYGLAQQLARAAREPSPGGEELGPLAAELLAVFMGFGLFMANCALEVGRGCSGCATGVQRLGYLTEDEFTYALGIFCVLKDIPEQAALPHLKKTLHSTFRRAVKELGDARAEDMARLRSIDAPIKQALAQAGT
jgi:hypothetical protein